MIVITKDYTIASIIGEATKEKYSVFQDYSSVLIEKEALKDGKELQSILKQIFLNLKPYLKLTHTYDLSHFDDSVAKKSQKLLFYDVKDAIEKVPEILELWILINNDSCWFKGKNSSLFNIEHLERFLHNFIPCVIISPNGKLHGRALLWRKNKDFMLNLYHSHIEPYFDAYEPFLSYSLPINGIYVVKNKYQEEEVKEYIDQIANKLKSLRYSSHLGNYKVIDESDSCESFFYKIYNDETPLCEAKSHYTCEVCRELISDKNNIFHTSVGIMCKACYKKHYKECSQCKTTYNVDTMFKLKNKYVCEECYEQHYKDYSYCGDCQTLINTGGTVITKNGKVICKKCYHQNYQKCDCCKEVIDRNELFKLNNDLICEECYNDKTDICDECGKLYISTRIHEVYSHTLNRRYKFCDSCFDKKMRKCDICKRKHIDLDVYRFDGVNVCYNCEYDYHRKRSRRMVGKGV